MMIIILTIKKESKNPARAASSWQRVKDGRMEEGGPVMRLCIYLFTFLKGAADAESSGPREAPRSRGTMTGLLVSTLIASLVRGVRNESGHPSLS